MRKICAFTGTRAEYGIMSRLLRMIKDDPDLKLQIVATNMHLSPEFGLTYKEIEGDGFVIDKKVEMLLSSDTSNGTLKSMGLATIGFADALSELSPDLALIFGDRYEMMAAATACLINKIPVAHVGGGEITEGAYDDAIRHCITKMSHLHFTETEEYWKRVIQLGESPERVFCVGAPGVNNIRSEKILSLPELEQSIGFNLGSKYLLVTFHPVTLEADDAGAQCDNLLNALKEVSEEYKLLFTLPNSDTNGRIIADKVRSFVLNHPDSSISVVSLGKKRYFSALKHATAVVGNSSSGLIEAPSFNIPTLNIGIRQKGRTRGASVYDVPATFEDIKKGLNIILSEPFMEQAKNAINPYEKDNTIDAIFQTIKRYPLDGIINKQFYDLPK